MAEMLAKAPAAPDFESMQRGVQARGAQGLQAAQDVVRAEAEQKGAELESQAKLAGEKAQKQKELRVGMEQEIAGLEKQMFPAPERKMTQEDATTYAQLASVVATLGLMLGGGAKGSAKVALSAMNGMMKGWQAGRKDLWERESKTFEAELRKMKAQNDDVNRRIERAMKLMPLKRDEAMAELEAASYIAGKGILAKAINTGNFRAIAEYTKSTNNELSALQQLQFKNAQEERRHQERIAAQDRQRNAMIQAARIRAAAQAAKGGGGLLKPGAEVTKNYLGQNALLADMQDIAKDLKDPKMRQIINEYQLESFASEELGKIVAQIANDKLPSELRKFLVKVRNVRNNYYLTISGKAVTGGEALRNYGVVSQPGDNAEVMSDKTEAMVKQVERTIGQYQRLYGLPSIDTETINTFRAPGENSNFDVRSLPAQDDSVSVIPKVGEIRDGYRFKGGNPGDKSNWEQVQ